MASATPLQGIELVDCAKANAKQGIEIAANLCGYGDDLTGFRQELQTACDRMGVEFYELTDLVTDQQAVIQLGGVEIAPETKGNL